jgi:hypothetical protein
MDLAMTTKTTNRRPVSISLCWDLPPGLLTFGMIELNISFIFSRSIRPSGQSSMKPWAGDCSVPPPASNQANK